jgi:hypothetical protein
VLASATLTDTGGAPMARYITRHEGGAGHLDISSEDQAATEARPAWIWRVTDGALPQFPPNARAVVAA